MVKMEGTMFRDYMAEIMRIIDETENLHIYPDDEATSLPPTDKEKAVAYDYIKDALRGVTI